MQLTYSPQPVYLFVIVRVSQRRSGDNGFGSLNALPPLVNAYREEKHNKGRTKSKLSTDVPHSRVAISVGIKTRKKSIVMLDIRLKCFLLLLQSTVRVK